MINKLKQRIVDRNAVSDLVDLYSGAYEGAVAGEDIKRVHQRRDQSAAYRESFCSTMETLAGLEVLADNAAIMALADNEEPAGRIGSLSLWPRLAVVATLLLALFAGFYIWNPPADDGASVLRYVTRVGEQKTISLADGSSMTLNTATQVLVDMDDQSRRVVLERGEAWFDVASDPNRPFSVELDSCSVSVLGTKFNILKEPNSFTLAVMEGLVTVHRKVEAASESAPIIDAAVATQTHGQRRVQAGTVIEYDTRQEAISARPSADIDRFSNWRSGVIRFEYEPLYKVVQELNRYLGKKILIEDDSIMNLKIYATVRIDNVSIALDGLESTLPIKVIRHFDRTVIVGDKNRELQ